MGTAELRDKIIQLLNTDNMSYLEAIFDFAKNKKWDNIILYSHRSLETAIHLYRNMGFVEIPVEENSHYERADIKMILEL